MPLHGHSFSRSSFGAFSVFILVYFLFMQVFDHISLSSIFLFWLFFWSLPGLNIFSYHFGSSHMIHRDLRFCGAHFPLGDVGDVWASLDLSPLESRQPWRVKPEQHEGVMLPCRKQTKRCQTNDVIEVHGELQPMQRRLSRGRQASICMMDDPPLWA